MHFGVISVVGPTVTAQQTGNWVRIRGLEGRSNGPEIRWGRVGYPNSTTRTNASNTFGSRA